MSVVDETGGGDSGDLDTLAAEYVIGTLAEGERSAFSSRLGTDEAARRAVADWERRLAPLHSVGGIVPPPAELWPRIQRALGSSASDTLRVVDGGLSARGAGSGASSASMVRSRDRWRLLALSAAGIAAALVAFVVIRESDLFGSAEAGATYVAAVNRGGDKPAMIVTVDLKTRQVLVRPVAAQAPAGHSLELWYIGNGAPPRSMGLVSDAVARKSIPSDAAADGAATFAISVEPPGGSKTGGPTGEVLYSGQLVRE